MSKSSANKEILYIFKWTISFRKISKTRYRTYVQTSIRSPFQSENTIKHIIAYSYKVRIRICIEDTRYISIYRLRYNKMQTII